MAGRVFARAGARMSVMWHLAVDHETVGPVFARCAPSTTARSTIAQDLTTFDITKDAVVARQATIDPFAWPVVGPTTDHRPADVRAARAAGVVGRRPHHRLTGQLTAAPIGDRVRKCTRYPDSKGVSALSGEMLPPAAAAPTTAVLDGRPLRGAADRLPGRLLHSAAADVRN